MLTIRIDMEMCRVCLRTGIGTSLYQEDLSDKFNEVTGLSISPEDGLPGSLCAKCLSRLTLAHDFRTQSIESENHLNDFIAQVNKEFQHKIPIVPEDGPKGNSSDMELELLLENGYLGEEGESVQAPRTSDREEEDEEIAEYVKMEDFTMKDIIEDCQEEEEEEEESEIAVKDEIMEIEELDEEIIEKIIEEEPSYDEVDVPGDQDVQTSSHDIDQGPSRIKRREISTIDSHYCIKCDKDFSTRTNLHRHMQTHDGQKPFICSICGNGFTQKGSLKQHMHLHTGERPYHCSVCDRRFTQAKTLVNHMRRHTGEKPFQCGDCGTHFRQKDGLKRHMLRHQDLLQRAINCSICNRQFVSKYSLDVHLRKHSSDQKSIPNAPKYKCTECNRHFVSPKTLEAHQRAHAGEAPFKCTFENCEAAFVRQSSLKSHIKRHEIIISPTDNTIEVLEIAHVTIAEESSKEGASSEPPSKFQCNRCPKVFTLKRNLLIHLKNHNLADSHMFKCDECKIGFTSKRSLKLHRKNHHREVVPDLNQCEECGVDFVSYIDLVTHINETHDEIDANCFFCGEHFRSKNAMSEHILEHEYNEDVMESDE